MRSRGFSAVFAIEPGLLLTLHKNVLLSTAYAPWLSGLTLDEALVLKREFAENSRLVTGVPALSHRLLHGDTDENTRSNDRGAADTALQAFSGGCHAQ
jgi:hypothetical protein